MNARPVRFKQVDVFSEVPFKGNALAVVFDADGMTDDQMQAIARWTNLSETTFVCRPSAPEADYLVRLFTPAYELPFAGHPTLGTAHALLDGGYRPRQPGRLVQQCGVGLVEVAVHGSGSMAFVAPPARIEPLDADQLQALKAALRSDEIDFDDIPPCCIDNGVPWLAIGVKSPQACVSMVLDAAAVSQIVRKTGMSGLAFYASHAPNGPATLEVRCIVVEGDGPLYEDPATGSANAGLASLFASRERRPASRYTVRQGTAIGREGRVTVEYDDSGKIWIGGTSITIVDGTFQRPSP
ncbi:PhzF family phenazine biosynthesis protein [Trinickia dinghuensis]|uniref:PhzF family phenazine biosynthesis protein n=1 Tax=Trinickia dinghuensis TaxID=2291023 RepID=A0A3D8JTV2_9BURK|nr:PhzF family phenazine biosynthesis protein [Trinickia dinghuensis]RDU96529.1 PhzF family phenazine biosynthesis protein [Trinickia dinghuensis]